MIVCGWCHSETAPDRCSACGRDPALPWVQRAEIPPGATDWRMAGARRSLGAAATVEQIAEHLAVSPRTVRRWQSGDLAVSAPSE